MKSFLNYSYYTATIILLFLGIANADSIIESSYQPLFHYDFENGFTNLFTNVDERSIIENSENVVIEEGQLKLLNSYDNDPRNQVKRIIDTSNMSKLLIEKRSYIVEKGMYSRSSTSIVNDLNERINIPYNYYHYNYDEHAYTFREHFYIKNVYSEENYQVSNLLNTYFSTWIDEKIEIDFNNRTVIYEVNDGSNKETATLQDLKFSKDNNTKLLLLAWDWANGSTHYIDDIKVSVQYNETTNVLGKIVTSSEILGYTASVGGATVESIPYKVSTTTNIYGEFLLPNLPIGNCTLQIYSRYFNSITKTVSVNSGMNNIGIIEIFEPNCQDRFSQEEVNKLVQQITTEKDEIILAKDQQIQQLNASIASMYTQGYLDQAILEAEKRGELKYDINKDGKVGLEEVIRYLETLSGIRVESLIIFPNDKKHYLSENEWKLSRVS